MQKSREFLMLNAHISSSNSRNLDLAETWEEIFESEGPIDFQAFLESDLLDAKRKQCKSVTIARILSGSISLIASSAIIWHILRSEDRLSTTYHRLVFGLCTGDIMFAMAFLSSATLAPKEFEYFLPFAIGNSTTCDLQGFFIIAGVLLVSIYNSSVCLYYLAIIKYNKKDEYIRKKLEPWLHFFPVIIALAISITLLVSKAYNVGEVTTLYCYLSPNSPPHCIGHENGVVPEGYSIPCGRGDLRDKPAVAAIIPIGYSIVYGVAPAIIVCSMFLMYQSVLKVERKMQKYGVGALRVRASVRGEQDGVSDDNNFRPPASIMASIKHSINQITSCLNTTQICYHSRSNQAGSQKRAVLFMATCYFIAWALTYVPFVSFLIFPQMMSPPITWFFGGLSGLYSYFVYMLPKVRNMKVVGSLDKITWWQAFKKAWLSRTDAKVSRMSIRSRGSSSRGASIRSRGASSRSINFNSRSPPFDSIYASSYALSSSQIRNTNTFSDSIAGNKNIDARSRRLLSIRGGSTIALFPKKAVSFADRQPLEKSAIYRGRHDSKHFNGVPVLKELDEEESAVLGFEGQVEDFLPDKKHGENSKDEKDDPFKRPGLSAAKSTGPSFSDESCPRRSNFTRDSKRSSTSSQDNNHIWKEP